MTRKERKHDLFITFYGHLRAKRANQNGLKLMKMKKVFIEALLIFKF